MLEFQSESESWWVSCVVITCDRESTGVWNDDLAFLDMACHDVAACTEPLCKEGPACDEPLARNTGAAPLVTTTDFLVCFRATNVFFFCLWYERECKRCNTDVFLEHGSSRHLSCLARGWWVASKGKTF